MIRDEFNQIEVKNDKQLLHTEFGKTQKVEFSSQNENKLPEGDLNEKYVGKTIKKVTEVNVDYVNKVPNHGAGTVVTTSSTATTAATVTAGTAVAASTVAVVAIATVTGISVAIHDYQYEFKSLIISSNELRYELYVYDAIQKDDKYLSYEDQDSHSNEEFDETKSAPYKLHVYNQNYDATQYLWERSTNMGVFDHLTLGDSYNIVLSENRYGGEEIFKDSFVTYVNSSIVDFELYQYTDYVEGTFDYSLDYIDDDNSISEINLEFYEVDTPNRITASFSLPKETGYQTMSASDENGNRLIDLNKEWGYRLSYSQANTKKTFKEDKVAFEDYAGRKAVFNDFIFDKTANFIDNSITVTLDYFDGMGWYEDFKLTLTQIPNEDQGANIGDEQYYSQEIPLAATTEPQTIVLNEYEMYVRESFFKYTYRLSCIYRGELTTLKEETVPFSFTDTSGGITEFYGLEFKKEANFLNNTFKVKLKYKDDFNALDSFQLHLLPDGVNAQYDFYLDKTTDEQTCTFNENDHWNFSFDYTYTYYLTYWNDYEEVRYDEDNEDFVFTDISGGVSEFNGFTFTGKYVMSTGLAPIQLSYQDDFNYLSNFVLHLFGPISSGTGDPDPLPYLADNNSGDTPLVNDYPYAINLEKTTDVQYINLYDADIPTSQEGEYLCAVTYDYRGVEQEPVELENKIEFSDPDAVSEVYGITFVNGEANFNERSFMVELDFKDDYGYFSNFTLQVRDTANGGWVERELEATTDPQKVIIDDFDYEEYKYPVDIVEGTLTYNLCYTTNETGDPSTQYLYAQEPSLSFINSLKSEFYGLETSYDFTQEEPDGEVRLPFRFDCVNDAEYFSVPELYFTPVDDETEILATIMFANEVMTNGWQYGSFSPQGDFTLEDMTNGDEYNVVVAYYAKDGYNGAEQRLTNVICAHSFTLNQKQEIYGISMQRYINGGDWQASLTVIANGDISEFTNGQIVFEDVNGEMTFIYDVTLSEYVYVDLLNPKNRTTTEQLLDDFFDSPVNVSFKYSKPGSSEIITLNCLSGFQFEISH